MERHDPQRAGARPLGESLAELLLSSLQALAASGNVALACRLAGQACVILRKSGEIDERRFNLLLHRLTPQLAW